MSFDAFEIVAPGTYTPITCLGLGGDSGKHLLTLVWAGAAAGIGQMMFWSKAHKAVATMIYVFLGWIILPYSASVSSPLANISFSVSGQFDGFGRPRRMTIPRTLINIHRNFW